MNTREHLHADEAGIEDLLREVGSRPEPSAEVAREVHEAVYAAWRATAAAHVRRRRGLQLGLAASVLLAVVATFFGVRYLSVLQPIAQVAYADGPVFVTGSDAAASPRRAAEGMELPRGETLTTAESRAALRFQGGLRLRIDANSIVRLVADDRIMVGAGAVYIDSGERPEAEALIVDTGIGSVRHVGTQYQVRVHEGVIEVLVREGRVEISSASGRSTGVAGERVKVSANGDVMRSAVARSDDAWRWTVRARAPFEIEDKTLDAFLAWAARETGRRLVYASEHAQQAAREIKLRGSIAGLEPDAALAAVLGTTRLHRYPTDDSHLGIALRKQEAGR